jgi:long-chain acyl-CoA synthetase
LVGGSNQLATIDPDRLAVSDGTVSFTRSELDDRVNRIIAMLRDLRVEPGNRIAVLAGNSADYVALASAAALGGMPLVPVNWHLSEDEVSYILESSRARILFVDAQHAELGSTAAASASQGPLVVSTGPTLEESLARVEAREPPADATYASPLYFTSGTTGRPKATRMSQVPDAIPVSAVVERLKKSATATGLGEDTIHLTMGPLYHAGPLNNACSTVLVGGTVHVMRSFDPEEVLRAIDTHRVNNTIMVPTHCVRLLRLPEEVRRKYDVSSMTRAMHIAATMPVEVKRRMIEWWGPVLSEGYGASEVGVVTAITSSQWLEKPGSVGQPIPSFTLQIVDDEGSELPAGEIGTIYMTSSTGVDLAYEDDAEKTAAAHRGPRQFTLGDMGWLDEDGFLYLADRRVDLIVSGGANIYPAEVESAMIMHPAIEDVGVFGIPDAEWGQQVKAAVQLAGGCEASDALATSILAWMRDEIAHFKVPRSIDFHAQLPRFSNGKLHRRSLRDPYWPAGES